MSEEANAKTRRRVESLFHEALSRSGAEREKLLAEACQDDPSLYQEVQSLLFHFEQSASPLDRSLLPQISAPAFNPGDSVGPYEILRQLGKGGMGEVYLARDQRLGRKVALKILSRDLAANPGLIERLRREAQTASALNHPNILTIYEFGHDGDLQYMVSEFVEGTELRELIGRLSTEEIQNYALQVGEALSAAHSVGIIHRDIKPENIMVRSDGYIKVLDFGLAKLLSPASATGESLWERLSHSRLGSVPGLLIGTVNYMSPEQVRGQALDHRTDIWSWGVVLYEMLAGKRPFEGATAGDVIAAILNNEPEPPTGSRELNRLVLDTLRKRPEDRPPTIAEATARLRNLRLAPSLRRSSLQRFSSYFMSWRAALVAALMAVAIALGYFYWGASTSPARVEAMLPLTTSGNVVLGAISPDGNYVAYATQEGRRQTLKLTEVGTGTELERIPAADGQYTGITFSPDNRLIFYVFARNGIGALYRLPVVGGEPRMVLNDVDSPISFAPDGTHFVFLRNSSIRGEVSLLTSSLEGAPESTLVTLHAPDNFFPAPLWSPDGAFILCGAYRDSPAGRSNIRFLAVQIKDGRQLESAPQPWYWIGKPAWLKGGRSLIVAANSIYSNRPQLFEMSWPKGAVTPVTRDTSDYRDLDSTPDSYHALTVAAHRDSNIWLVPLVGAAPPRMLVSGTYYGVAWAAGGSLISQTDTGGHPDLWAIDVTTAKSRAVTDDQYVEQNPSTVPGGKYVVYASNRDGTFHLWRSNLDGSGAVRLTQGSWPETEGSITPDGRWVIYSSNRAGLETLWKVSIEGNESTQITQLNTQRPQVSPDGQFIACKYGERPFRGWSTVILRASTGELLRSFPSIGGDSPVRWSADGKELFFIVNQNGVSNIWAQPVDGSKPRPLTHFTEETIFSFALSPDGRSLACIRGTRTSNLVLVQLAK